MDYRAEYEKWLREFADDAATVEELKALAGNEKEIEDRFYTELEFGTAGMRGVIGAGLNRMNVYAPGHAGSGRLHQPGPGARAARRGHSL